MLTGGKADPDLQGKVRAAKKAHKAKKKESYEIGTDEYTDHTKKVTPFQIKEWFESQVVRANYELKFGEDWWWKLNEVHDSMLEKIGASCCDDCDDELDESLLGKHTQEETKNQTRFWRKNEKKRGEGCADACSNEKGKREKRLTI